jgi:glutamine synthetase
MLINNVKGMKDIFSEKVFQKNAKMQIGLIEELTERIAAIRDDVQAMTEARKKANALCSAHEKAHAYCNDVLPYLSAIRYQADKIELIVDDEEWTLPKYREIMSVY